MTYFPPSLHNELLASVRRRALHRRLEDEILGKSIDELKVWYSRYAYSVASDSMSDPKCREVWERVGRAIRRSEHGQERS